MWLRSAIAVWPNSRTRASQDDSKYPNECDDHEQQNTRCEYPSGAIPPSLHVSTVRLETLWCFIMRQVEQPSTTYFVKPNRPKPVLVKFRSGFALSYKQRSRVNSSLIAVAKRWDFLKLILKR